MVDHSLEDDIFNEGAAQPGAAPSTAPSQPVEPPAPSDDDAAVSQVIGELARQTGRGAPVPRIPQSAPAAPAAPQPQQPQGDTEDRSQSGLLRALLDERERRQQMQERLRRFEEQEQRQQQQRPPISQRLFEDPEGTLNEIREEIRQQAIAPLEQRLAQVQVQNDFALASIRHADVFQDAWTRWYEQVGSGQDPQTYFRVMQAPSPGEALIQWHREQQVKAEVGDDPNAYRARLEAEIREKLMQEMGMAPAPAAAPQADDTPRRGNGQFAPRHQVRLPTATSRMGNANPQGGTADMLDGSDDAIFDAARPKRR